MGPLSIRNLVVAGAALTGAAVVAGCARDDAPPRTDDTPAAQPPVTPPTTDPVPAPDPDVSPAPAAPEAPEQAARGARQLRVATLNVHRLIPAGKPLQDARESEAVLRDVARWIRQTDPDVIVFQELSDDDLRVGLGRQLQRLGKLVGASDSMMASRFANQPDRRMDNAIITRNGVTITDGGNARLPSPKSPDGRRSAGIARIHAPHAGDATILFTHLNVGDDQRAGRRRDLTHLSQLAMRAHRGEPLAYTDAETGSRGAVRTGDGGAVVLLGDFNARPGEVGAAIAAGPAARLLVNSMDAPGIPDEIADAPTVANGNRIDHVLVSRDATIDNTWVSAVEPDAVLAEHGRRALPTDHDAVVVDLTLPG